MIELVRERDFPQLRQGQVYADWTGSAIASALLIDEWTTYQRETLLGNPHSHHKPSSRVQARIAKARRAVLEHFNAIDEYEVIFTQNASAAILLLQHYQFEKGELLLTADNHNSVLGLRETAWRNNAMVHIVPLQPDLTINAETVERMLNPHQSSLGQRLFCYPAKSNYAGTMHPLEWVAFAKERGWDVLLDAAAFVSNDRLDLSIVKPDFVPISFYKMFGLPTGVGCLLIRKDAYSKLAKRFFAGGSIRMVSVQSNLTLPPFQGYAQYEDGTPNFAAIPMVVNGLKFLQGLHGLKDHATQLATTLYDALRVMGDAHNNIVLYSARGNDIVAFNIQKQDGIVLASDFETAASAEGVFARTGRFCNPGVNEALFPYSVDAYLRLFADGLPTHEITTEKLREYSGGRPVTAIRASFGYANCLDDIHAFAAFTRAYLEDP